MGFSLSNLLKQGTAQVNPFDHGQTAATVKKQQQQPVVAKLPAPGQIHAAPQMAPVARHVMAPVMPHQNPLIHAFGNVDHAFNNVAHAGGNTVNAIATGARDTGGAIAATNRFLKTPGLGVQRSLIGTAQGASGLYDLATPGKGNNRVSQYLNKEALKTDQQGKTAMHPNLYKPGQLVGDLATFNVAGKAAKVAGLVTKALPGGEKAAAITSKVANLVNNLTTKMVTEGNLPTRLAGAAAHGVTSNLAPNAAFTALQTGANASKGRDTSIGNVGLGLAEGTALSALTPVAGQLTKEGVQATRTGARITAGKVMGKPAPHVTDQELAAANRVRMHQQGGGDTTLPTDVQHYRNVQKKLGVTDINNPNAVDDLIGARMTYQNRTPLQNALRGHQPLSLDASGKALVSEDGSTLPTVKKLLGKGKQAAPSPAAVSKKTGSSEGSIAPTAATATKPTLPAKPAATAAPRKPGLLTSEGGSGASTPKSNTFSKITSDVKGYAPQHKQFYQDFTTKYDQLKQRSANIQSKGKHGYDSDGNSITQLTPALQKRADVVSKQVGELWDTKITYEYKHKLGDYYKKPTTPVDLGKYINQQAKAQDAARKAGQDHGLTKVKAATADLKSKFVDSFSPIEDKLNQKITPENATQHITPQIDRALRSDTIAGQYIKDNGLAKVIQNVPNTKEFDQYLIAKHAPAFEAEHGVGSSGRDLAADKQLVDALSSKYESHAQAINKYSQSLLDKAVDYGLVSKEAARALKARYPDYVPMNRIFSEDELTKPPVGTGGGKASIGSQTVVKRAKGSQRVIESPMDSLIHKTQDVIDQGERNRAAQILTSYRNLPGNPFSLRELGKNETVGTKPVISVLENGKKRQFETTPEVAAAAKSLNKQQLGLVGRILSVPTRILRLGATGLNPAFAGANVLKDLASGAINSKNPLRSSVANPHVFLKALAAATNHGSKSYSELVREGAGGTSFDIGRNAAKKNVASIRAQKNVGTRIAYTVTHPAQLFRAAENAIGRSEEFSRALQYYGGKDAALAKGASPEAAKVLGAHAARNNTVNFARAGDYVRVLNSVVPYLNAGVQGSRTLVRNIGEHPAQMAGKLAVIAFFPTAATTAWNISSPDRKAAYDDIKDYEKQGNLIIVPPNPKKDPVTGKWNVIKIPVSQEIANLNNVVRNGVEVGMKDGTFKKGQFVGDMVGTGTSLNVGTPRQAAGQVIPQAAKPVIEALTNQNLYTGNKIVPDSQKNLDAKDQYGTNTSGTARVIGRNINISPRQIDNLISTSTGGLGQNAVHGSDLLLSKTGNIKPNEVKGKSLGTSIASRFEGAQGSNQYDQIDKKDATLTKQLKATPGYQSMTPADKAKALNRLTSAVTNTYTSTKALTPKQQAIDDGTVKVSDYLTASKSGGTSTPISPTIDAHSQKVLKEYNTLSADQRKAKAYNETDYDYKVAQAKYDNDKANNKLTKAGAIKAQDALTKAKVGSSYSKDTRDLYGLSKGDIYNLITTDPNGNKIASDLKNYDKALYDAGLSSSLKFKYGFGSVATSGGKRTYSAGRAAKGSSPSEIASAWTNHSTASQKYEKSLRAIAQHAALKGIPKITTKSGSKRVATFKEPKSSGISTVKLGSRKTLAKKLYA